MGTTMASPIQACMSEDFRQRVAELDVLHRPISVVSRILYDFNIHHDMEYRGLLPKQVDALKQAMKRDCLVVLPTGYGKSLIFYLLPFITQPPQPVIIASPLDSIIEEQSRKMSGMSLVLDGKMIQCLELVREGEDLLHEDMKLKLARLRGGDYLYLIGHPEHITSPLVKDEVVKLEHAYLVVDEAHCTLSWGCSNFRPAFLKLKTLRCFMPTAKILALTATAATAAQRQISHALNMADPAIVHLPPDRYVSTIVLVSLVIQS